MRRPSLEAVVRSGMCIGCGACKLVAPSKVQLAPDTDGFLRPHLSAPLSEAERERFLQTCPATNVAGGDRTERSMWGSVQLCCKAHATDPEVRHIGSSGGTLTALTANALASDIIASVATIRPAVDAPLTNEPLVTSDPNDLISASGSRYAPAAPLLGLLDGETPPGKLLFVGKPCDVAAARALEDSGGLGGVAVYAYVSFLCAGTPTIKGTYAVLEALKVPRAQVTTFRYRGHGWPGRATAMGDGFEASMSYDQSWGRFLGTGVHDRCKYCADGIGLSADIVLGDAWRTDRSGPIFDEAPGESLVFVRTDRGRELFDSAVAGGAIQVAPLGLDEVEAMQPHQAHRRRYAWARLLGRRLLGRHTPRYARAALPSVLLTRPHPLVWLREFAGAIKRSVGRGQR